MLVHELEFDGDTVLCRVCGDKASGFHYGVHACEGCKGFFRRSIQQKIQYRPCLKNQQCNIMRVNRNRCQYCRLKKCIAVGMSRDAVRFGRVPKKEKAKILEQMQKVNSTAQSAVLSAMLDNPRDVTRQVVDAHMSISLFTQGKVKELTERVWQHPQFVTCAAHMACPLNPRFEDSNAGKWPSDFTDYFTPAIRNVVSFAKCIPGFSMLNQEDQVTLLKAGTFEVLLLYMAKLFDSKTNTMIFSNGKLYKRPNSTSNQSTNSAGFLLDSMFDFAERLNSMELSDDEIALFSALVIVTSDRPGLRNVEQVDQIQNCLSQGLQQVCSASHPDDPAMFTKLMMKIPDLRTLNTLHSEKLLGMSVPAMSLGGMKPDPMSPTKASPPPANYNHHPYAAAESLIAGYPMMASADLPRSARMSYLEAATSPRMEVRPSVAGGRYDSAVKIATSSSPSEHHPLPAASENLRHHHMSGGGMVGSKDFYQGLNDVRKHLLTRHYGDAAGTKECGSPDFTAALDAGGRESELVDLSMKCPVSRKRLHADDEPISPPKMLKTEPSTHMPSYGQYPIGFPFYPFSPRFTSSDVDMSMLEKLRVNTRHSPVEGDTSPLHSGGSTSSSQMPLLTHALNSPPLLSAWKSRNETSSHERDRMSDRTSNKRTSQTDVDDKHRSSLDNEEDGTKVRKLVSHSIDRLMGMSKAERETEDQQNANHERSPTDSRSDSMNRAEPDSTQPDVDAASHHHQQQQEQRCNSHGSSDTKRSVSLSDDDSDAGAEDNKPTKWSPPTSRTTPAGPALPLGGFSSAAVHPAQLLYQYSQYNQYAAVQQYAQQMAHQVAVAQLQAAQRAALDVADNRSQSPRQPLNLIGSKFSDRNDVISHVKPEPV